jgi:hypothetical protein
MRIEKLPYGIKTIKQLYRVWNSKFPLDKWYRDKYSIPFFSKQHLETNIIAVKMEFIEHISLSKMIEEVTEKREEDKINHIKKEKDDNFIDWDKFKKNGED